MQDAAIQGASKGASLPMTSTGNEAIVSFPVSDSIKPTTISYSPNVSKV